MPRGEGKKKKEKKKGGFGPAANAKKTGQRAFDAFYTKRSAADECVRSLLSHVVASETAFVEPAAGAGVFVDALVSAGVGTSGVVAMDVQPSAHPAVEERDFFEWKPPSLCVFGNPPFGKNASLAAKFFNRAAEFSDAIAFVVPRSFLKPAVENRLDLRFEKVEQFSLPQPAFEFEGEDRSVPTVWQVWRRIPGGRKRLKVAAPTDFGRVSFERPGSDLTTVLVQRVGQRAGRCYWDPEDWERYGESRNYHWVLVDGLTAEERGRLEDAAAGFESIAGKGDSAGMASLTRAEVAGHVNGLLSARAPRKSGKRERVPRDILSFFSRI